jgi:hypothetical protein
MTTFVDKYGSAVLAPAELERLRQSVLDQLTEAYASDLVSLESYETRAGLVQGASTARELDQAMEGLKARRPAPASRERPRAPIDREPARAPNRIDDSLSGVYNIACVMGDRQLTGDWLDGDQVGSFTMMGSTKIDLRDTALPPGRLKIDAFCLMGETKIIVPRGLPVRLNVFPFMGEAKLARDVRSRVLPGEPFVEVNGFAMMGSLVVVAAD